VLINVSDIMGRQLIHKEYRLKCGHHSFTFFPGRESIYFLTARMDQQSCTIKMFNTPSLSDLSGNCKLEYGGNPITPEGYKASIALNGFVFSLGNQLKFTAYTALGERTIIDTPAGNMTYTFQYGSGGIPCPGMPTVTWQGVTYHTVLIGDQCWLKENMNWETGISWCYDYDPSNCEIYGRLYNWPTALGVCPTGWHLPSDEEWKEIEGVVDNQYGYPDPEWDQTGWRGYDAGLNLKSTTGWNTGGNGPDPYGFSALPGGTRAGLGLFYGLGHDSAWWTSTENVWSTAWRRYLSYYSEEANRYYYSMYYAFYVRCLRDY
ncbi:MAG: hypothetical protein JW861_10725, partial [Bacteroidales bacterium]|nr:hypothetical protein [Bacteroidales bacterium]